MFLPHKRKLINFKNNKLPLLLLIKTKHGTHYETCNYRRNYCYSCFGYSNNHLPRQKKREGRGKHKSGSDGCNKKRASPRNRGEGRLIRLLN